MNLRNFKFEKKVIYSWNNNIKSKALVIYPKNIDQLKIILKNLKKNKLKYLIRTGSCSYDSKSINLNMDTLVISLKFLNKIKKIDRKNKLITVEAGAFISHVIKIIKEKSLTLYSVPGGEKVSIGGAISANTIGKDSSSKISSFGDSIHSLDVLTENGKIKNYSKNSLNKFVGAFGINGIILRAKIKLKYMKSQNLLVSTKILNNITEIKKEFNKKFEYHYIQVDPFFRKNHYAISFQANSIISNRNVFKKINLRSYKIDEYFLKLLGFFINFFTWKIFYKLFFLVSKKNKELIDIHNFHYNSRYKHLIPKLCKDGLNDYEILIKDNFEIKIKNLFEFLRKLKIYPMYIIIKKLYKSQKKYFYQFNENGYAVAVALNKSLISSEKLSIFKSFLEKNKYNLNLAKTDEKHVILKRNDNKLFLSLYKKMILDRNEI